MTPVFVVGMPRSGTTYLAHLIAQHRDVTHISRKHFVGYIEYSEDNHELKETNCFNRWDSEFIKTTFDKFTITSHALEKTPFHSLMLAKIFSIFPNAKIIAIKRDPVKSMASCLDWNIANFMRKEDVIIQYNAWWEGSEAQYNIYPTLQIKYEDLRDDYKVLEKIFIYCDLDPIPAKNIHDEFTGINIKDNRLYKGKRKVDEPLKKFFIESMCPSLRKFYNNNYANL